MATQQHALSEKMSVGLHMLDAARSCPRAVQKLKHRACGGVPRVVPAPANPGVASTEGAAITNPPRASLTSQAGTAQRSLSTPSHTVTDVIYLTRHLLVLRRAAVRPGLRRRIGIQGYMAMTTPPRRHISQETVESDERTGGRLGLFDNDIDDFSYNGLAKKHHSSYVTDVTVKVTYM